MLIHLIGYLLGGVPGALLATLGIFLPSFLFIGLIHPIAARLRSTAWTAMLLDGVNAAVLALMSGVLVQPGEHALTDVLTWALTLGSFTVLLRWKHINLVISKLIYSKSQELARESFLFSRDSLKPEPCS